jgi:hypothetical protein
MYGHFFEEDDNEKLVIFIKLLYFIQRTIFIILYLSILFRERIDYDVSFAKE